MFFTTIGLEGSLEEKTKAFVRRGQNDKEWAFAMLVQFIAHQKRRYDEKQITAGTLRNYYKPIKVFCEVNDVILNWKKITRGFPKSRKFAKDRAPTTEEIRKAVEYPDRRIRPIVYLMSASGIRVGAWDYLKWGHIEPVFDNDKKVLAARVIVYAGEPEEYFTLTTPEAYHSLEAWMKMREEHGEKIGPDSWLMRDIFKTTSMKHGANVGLAAYPKKLKSSAIRTMLKRAWISAGLGKESSGEEFSFKSSHGFRKRFKTICESSRVLPLNVECLLGHDTGIAGSAYYRPSQEDLLNDYLKAVPRLQISEAAELKEKSFQQQQNNQLDLKNMQDQIARLQNQLSFLVSEGLFAKNAIAERTRPNQLHT
jgi:hypothetical protein